MNIPPDLITRTSTAIIIVAVTLVALSSGALGWGMFCITVAAGMMDEWRSLTATMRKPVFFSGLLVISCAVASATLIYSAEHGFTYLGFLIACVSATDIFAYFGGKTFGRTKLAPTISPNKTVEGLISGMIAASVTALLIVTLSDLPMPAFIALATGATLAFVAQMGDLLESAAKRRADVKDSGALLPGHGGLLDRTDGYITALPVFYAMLHYSNHLN